MLSTPFSSITAKTFLNYPKSGYKYGCYEEFAITIHEKSKNKNIISADGENILIMLNILNIPMGKQRGVENVVSPNFARSVIQNIGKILKPHAEIILSIPNVLTWLVSFLRNILNILSTKYCSGYIIEHSVSIRYWCDE